ncbi:MAG TPA: CGNR zinc finger domain-containing protein [Symbiobacteriaceae bacterium]|nr:CGNR zinc finger domain-containing protein [Symbiobacteriaceae bacterium]
MGSRVRAQGLLGLLQDFVNTAEFLEGRETFQRPSDVARWLVVHQVADDGLVVEDAGLRQALALREALRALLLANNGGSVEPAAIHALNQAASASGLRVQLSPQGRPEIRPTGGGVDQALGKLLAAAFTAMSDGSFARLKACLAPECRWAFFDRSPNGRSTWCEMETCGSRHKMRTYRQRKKQTGAQ